MNQCTHPCRRSMTTKRPPRNMMLLPCVFDSCSLLSNNATQCVVSGHETTYILCPVALAVSPLSEGRSTCGGTNRGGISSPACCRVEVRCFRLGVAAKRARCRTLNTRRCGSTEGCVCLSWSLAWLSHGTWQLSDGPVANQMVQPPGQEQPDHSLVGVIDYCVRPSPCPRRRPPASLKVKRLHRRSDQRRIGNISKKSWIEASKPPKRWNKSWKRRQLNHCFIRNGDCSYEVGEWSF